jgi:thioredoxin 1
MSELINLNKESFSKVISSENKTILIDFWAPWCGPCKALTPILEDIANEKGDQVGVYKVNVDENTDLAQEHGVQSIPTLLLYKNGSLSETIVGLKSKEELIQLIDS